MDVGNPKLEGKRIPWHPSMFAAPCLEGTATSVKHEYYERLAVSSAENNHDPYTWSLNKSFDQVEGNINNKDIQVKPQTHIIFFNIFNLCSTYIQQ